MLISLRASFGAMPAVSECTWPQFVSWYREQANQTYSSKDECPLVAFAAFAGGFKRENLDPKGLWALVLDFDHVASDLISDFVMVATAVAPCSAGLIHTTFSHGTKPDEARLRVIYPSEQPIPAAHYVEAWAEAVAEFAAAGYEVDPMTGNPERCWFLPAINPNAPEWARRPWLHEFVKGT